MSAAAPQVQRRIGASRSAAGRFTRVVDRLVRHGSPVDFRELCRRVVPESTRYLVIDLDRTIHLALNMGELLGWEICAFHGYGPDRFAELTKRRRPGRFLWDSGRPLALARYLAVGARMWAYPGLFYFVFAKLAPKSTLGRRLTYSLFGPDPVGAIQRIPQLALMHHMSDLPLDLLRDLARGLFQRYQGEQVLDRDDLAWLRSRCGNLRIIISSASPQPVVEAAAEALGVNEIIHSEIPEHAGTLAAPWVVDRRFLQPGAPHYIAEPGCIRINGGYGKIEELQRRHPGMFSGDTVTIGITDNGSGEDQCWAQHFTKVIEVNGTSPFCPVVAHDSPLRELHSASLLTKAEQRGRLSGERTGPNRRRRTVPEGAPVVFVEEEMSTRLAGTIDAIESVASQLEGKAAEIADAYAEAQASVTAVRERIATTVERYNEAGPKDRGRLLWQLRFEVAECDLAERRMRRLLRPVSLLSFEIERLIEHSRRELEMESARPAAALLQLSESQRASP